ncbi:hypothetical protein B0H19DRAFT_375651 [Mycena capillaripes]|nr:hypothetical protein B0H19DRAFT_375651 [Mycena capillaripes]
MNVIQNSPDPFLPSLCRALTAWLIALRTRMTLHAVFPEQFPYDPNFLPLDFPFTQVVVHKTFDFSPFPLSYQIAFEYHGRTPCASHLWMITCGTVILGVFEVPGEIFDGHYPDFHIGSDIVIDAMVQSVRARTKFVLLSTVVESPVADGGLDYQAVEMVTLTNASHWQRGRTVAVRYMQQCRHCDVLVPHPGPQLCPLHALSL